MRLGSPPSASPFSSSDSSSPAPATTTTTTTPRFPNPSSRRRDSTSRLSSAPSRPHSSTAGLRLGGGGGGGWWSSGPQAALRGTHDALLHWSRRALAVYDDLTPPQRAAACAAGLVLAALAVLALLYTEAFFAWLATVSSSWRALRLGWLINVLLIAATSFPPIIGYSTANTIAGFVYGFPNAWPIAAGASVAGSLLAFLACRTVLSAHVHRFVGDDHRFVALGQVLRQDGLLYLTAIRFCPLPFSLSNGFLATIPSITPTAFALSTAISTPKLLIHVFIGSQMAVLAEKGDKMPLRDRLVNYASMAVFGSLGALVGYIIYRRTFARAAELARDALAADARAEAGEQGAYGAYGFEYDDQHAHAHAHAEDAALMDPEDAADIMGDDDVSLWNTQMSDDADDYDGGGHSRGSRNGKK
ncbi:Golgi apparatus membrane protein tvp38 [Escovopsis weberi]|uniref:Golgi apparatus membrane protein TVP38 n=1 Tax=Escovopsis weberi TaxID=150374 RepID=A0A0M8MT31_ESCWE|nr:Golgi apparatus membrane protein tvp38 [Escovopsis weberi]